MKAPYLGTRVMTLALLLAGSLAARVEAQPAGAGGLACNFVGRIYIDKSGGLQAAGYFTSITGIAGPLFSGTPGEGTAFFTFRSNVFQLTPLAANGDLQLSLIPAGTYAIYFDRVPVGDWSDPNTFSAGQPIAKFNRPEGLDLQFTQTSQHVVGENLVSAQPFTFNGRNYDFNAIAPGGLTLFNAVSNTPLLGISDFPVVLPYAGSCIAVDGTGWR